MPERVISRRRLLAGTAAATATMAVLGDLAFAPSAFAQSNAIVTENAKAGTSEWRLTQPSDDTNGQLWAYFRQTSAKPGETLQLCVHTNLTQAVSARVYRMGYYGGARGRQLADLGSVTVSPQAAPTGTANPTTGERICDWNVAWSFVAPATWLSGVYLVKLTNAAGYQTHATFTILDDRPAAVLHVQSVLNYQAYNAWPTGQGKNFYPDLSYGSNTVTGDKRATIVNMDRPYQNNGSGLFLDFEADLVAWMEQNGRDVSYTTNIDVHLDRTNLQSYGAIVSAGHDEYWTQSIWDRFVSARDNGVDLLFAASNHAYWRTRVLPAADGRPGRKIEEWKEFQNLDPNYTYATSTARFRDYATIGSEQVLVGVQYQTHITYNPNGAGQTNYVPTNTGHWVWSGSGASNGVPLSTAIVGYEIDGLQSGKPTPPGSQTLLSASSLNGITQNTSIYQAPSGAWVFAAGTMAWTWALARSGFTHGAIQTATTNVLNQMLSNWGTAARSAPPGGFADGFPSGGGAGGGPFAPFTTAGAFITQQYRDFLNRDPDFPSLIYWTNNLAPDGTDRSKLIGTFLLSAEFAPWYDVARLYQAVFARIPDAEGYQYWVNRYFARTITLQDMAAFFVTSPEWNAKYGPNLTSAQVIDAIYPNLFNRPPDPQGRAYWISRLDAGMPRHDLVLGFAESDEFKLATLAELATIASYQGLLRRVPNQGELNSWVGQLESGAQSALAMYETILRSPEYAARF